MPLSEKTLIAMKNWWTPEEATGFDELCSYFKSEGPPSLRGTSDAKHGGAAVKLT